MHAKVIRPYSHSLSDDEKLYRPDEERTGEAERDPVKRFGALLIDEGVIDQDGLQKIKDEVDREVNEAADQALAAAQPAPETATKYVFSPDVDPTSKEFDTEEGAQLSGTPGTMVSVCVASPSQANVVRPRQFSLPLLVTMLRKTPPVSTVMSCAPVET